MRVLILSCNTGGGHNAAGKALAERVRREGQEVRFLDIMSLAGEKTSRIVGNTYINVAKYTPRLFQAAYLAGGFISSAKHKSPVYLANTRMAGYLESYLREYAADILVMPHLFPAETVTYMKKHGMLNIPALAVSTDYTCIPFWEETDCDAYVIAHPDLREEYTDRGIPGEKLYPLGIPCSMEFALDVDKSEARKQLGLEPEGALFLIIGGSMGFGRIRELAQGLYRRCTAGEQIAVICGNDRRMYRELTEEFEGERRIHILGYTDQVPLWMDACDVVYTKPGGLTSTEALVKQVPMIHTAPIPGCETKNADFFCSRGMSIAEKSVTMQIESGMRLLRDQTLRRRMQSAQRENARPQASLEIYHLMERLCECVESTGSADNR